MCSNPTILNGSGGRIRTHEMAESESAALPLGDTRINNKTMIIIYNLILIFNRRLKKAGCLERQPAFFYLTVTILIPEIPEMIFSAASTSSRCIR